MDDTGDDLSNVEFARIRSQSKTIFRRPPSLRNFQQRKKTASSSRFSEICNSQNDPLVMKNTEEKTIKTGDSIRATSMEFDINTVHLQSSYSREQPKTHGFLSPTTTEPTTSPFDHPTFPSAALSRNPDKQIIRKSNREAAATIYPPHAITATLSLLEQSQIQEDSALDKEE